MSISKMSIVDLENAKEFLENRLRIKFEYLSVFESFISKQESIKIKEDIKTIKINLRSVRSRIMILDIMTSL